MATVPRAAAPRPDPTPAECRHARAAFHALFAPIAERQDLSDAAKLLHQGLVSMVRRGLSWTQAQLAEVLGWTSRQKVWRAAVELAEAGLVRIRRLGLGRPNAYVLVETEAVTREDIQARAPRTPVSGSGHQEGRAPNVPARGYLPPPKKMTKERGYIPPGTSSRCFGCGQTDHASASCPRYGAAFRR